MYYAFPLCLSSYENGQLLFRKHQVLEVKLGTSNDSLRSNPDHGQLRQHLAPGTVLANRYSIQEVIGVGGMGSVYRARDLHFPNVMKLVAVKEMINTAPDPQVRKSIIQNFEREAHILATLSHPAITKIFDYFTFDERSYLVLEYIRGKDLELILQDYQAFIPEQQIINWSIEICDVLQYLHSHKPEPIIFRDVKPSNIMINQQNHVVLIDFGIAKLFKTGQKGTMIGTEGYSPPEQYRGEASPAADIYALGATLHHVLTRCDPRSEPPFTFSERPISKINSSVSAGFEKVIYTALQYNPQDRYPTALAMKEALIFLQSKSAPEIPVGVDQEKKEVEAPNRMIWNFLCQDEIRGSAVVENDVIYFGSYDHHLYALHTRDGGLIWKYATEGGIVGKPFISDSIVYFGSEDKRLLAVSAKTGKLSWAYETEGAIRCSPQISEGHIFWGSDDGYLYAVHLASGRLTWKIDAGTSIRSTPCVFENGVVFGSESGEVLCVDFRGQIKWRFKAKKSVMSSPVYSQGIIYISSLDATLYALDAKNGWILWRFNLGKGSISSPCKNNDFVYVGSADGNIYCVDTKNGREVWKFRTEHQVSGSANVVDDTVYCGSADGYLYSLEASSGKMIWKFKTQGPITGTPLVYENMVVIGSLDHNLYAIKIH